MRINLDEEPDEEAMIEEDGIRPSNLEAGKEVKTKMNKINIVHRSNNS